MAGMSEAAQRKLRVLLIYRVMMPSVRLCGHCQMEWLSAAGKVEYRAVQELKLKASDMNWADVVLLGRLDSWYDYQLASMLRSAGKYLVYVLDDDLLNIPSEYYSAAYFGQAEIQGYIRGMMELSDAILSPSPRLLEKYATDGRRAIQLEEPAIDPVEYAPHDADGPIRIGFAGSIDRVKDIEVILKRALTSIKETYCEKVVFEFFGAIPDFARSLDARSIPYCETYENYRRKLNELQWDIGLAPMPDTPFHACKHYNKFSEYAAAGIVGVFSDVYPYTRIRAFPECAVFCDNTADGWIQALRGLIEDSQRREAYRRRAVWCAGEYLSLSRCAEGLEANLPDIVSLKPSGDVVCHGLGLMKIRGLQKRMSTKVKGYGATGLLDAAGKRVRAAVGR